MSSTLREGASPRAYALARDRGPLDLAPSAPRPARRRGRPPLATPQEVLGQILEAHARGELFRVHLDQPALYARARRLWGSWAGALHAAGLDYELTMVESRRRALDTRRRKAGERASRAS